MRSDWRTSDNVDDYLTAQIVMYGLVLFEVEQGQHLKKSMDNLLLFKADDTSISAELLEQILSSVRGFTEIRRHTPAGTLVEAHYSSGDDFTTVRLNSTGKAISISSTSPAALEAAIVVQRGMPFPLRIINMSYSFDLSLQDYENVRDLEAAIDAAQGM